MARSSNKLVRPLVRSLGGYVPGEQPGTDRPIKLNTNENAYPPSEKVLSATRDAADGRLRLYPDPSAAELRGRLARFHGCTPDAILVGNGSDELLAVLIRGLVEPLASVSESRRHASTVQFFSPGYSLYRVLTESHGARAAPIALESDFALPTGRALQRAGFRTRAALTFVTTPNAPSGRAYSVAELETVCCLASGVVVLDEAYIDFGGEPAVELALRHPHVVVARTFSKGYSLCFQRIGYLIGAPDLLAELAKLRDSYSVNGLGQVAAIAALADRAGYRSNIRRVVGTRKRLASRLGGLGFSVLPSVTNFLLVEPPGVPAGEWFEYLHQQGILVRWFRDGDVSSYLRITVGTDEDCDALVAACSSFLDSS